MNDRQTSYAFAVVAVRVINAPFRQAFLLSPPPSLCRAHVSADVVGSMSEIASALSESINCVARSSLALLPASRIDGDDLTVREPSVGLPKLFRSWAD